MRKVTLLTVADMHQQADLYLQLQAAVTRHRPDAVLCVGDFLDAGDPRAKGKLASAEAARMLAELPAEHVAFTRGNHEEENWQEFVATWPAEQRPLVALHGTVLQVGPLLILGFPCFTGWEDPWEWTMPKEGNLVLGDASEKGRSLPVRVNLWLKPLLVKYGPAARALWVMHEPPLAAPIAESMAANRFFGEAVSRYQPWLTISGHDHETPLRTGKWRAPLGRTTCVNLGQGRFTLRYCVIEATFSTGKVSAPERLIVTAHPQREALTIATDAKTES